MKFAKGQPRPPNAGRKAGEPNKKKIPKAIDILAENNFIPVQEMIDLIRNGELRDSEKGDLMKFLQTYCEAKPKDDLSIDEESSESDPIRNLSEAQLLKLVETPDEAV